MKLDGKVALITGGGTGIGFGICSVLESHGANVVAAGLPLSSEPGGVTYFEVDIADRQQVEELINRITDAFGRIDILVNNAAITGKQAIAPFLQCSESALNRMIDVNLKGVFHCSQAAARHMVATGTAGSIVHISSVGAFAAQEHASVYCATKAAVESLARSMALELASHNIRVNCIAPGDILTPTNADIVSDLKTGGASGKYIRLTPLGRRGTPEDVGSAVAYLASDEASFVTGTTLRVDGGFLSY